MAFAWSVTGVPVSGRDATELLRDYFTEMVSRYVHRAAGQDEVDAALAEDPSDALTPPSGAFLLARHEGRPAGCVGVKLLDEGLAEIKRMFVHRGLRGLGGGSQLVRAAEQTARDLGATTVRLDTRHDLVEARALYAKHGYVETPSYAGSPYADHWFEKVLVQR